MQTVVQFPGNLSAVENLAALRGVLSYALRAKDSYLVQGSATFGDGLGGIYAFDPGSVANDDDRTVIRPADRTPLQMGRWVLTTGATTGGGEAGNTEAAANIYIERPELLAPLLVPTLTGQPATMILSGDSTTNLSGQYSDELAAIFSGAYPNVTITKSGASGQHTGDWLQNWLPAEKAASPTCLVWGWGLNDLFTPYGRTLIQFENDLRAGLTSYRQSNPKETHVVILLSTNTARDDAQGRGVDDVKTLIPIIKKAAVDFDCVFIDRFKMYEDAYADEGDNSMIDNVGVHPQPPLAKLIAKGVYQSILPTEASGGSSGGMFGDPTNGPPSSLAPGGYPLGLSFSRTNGNDADPGWRFNGFAVTFVPTSSAGNFALQINYPFTGTQRIAYRLGLFDGDSVEWAPWVDYGLDYMFGDVAAGVASTAPPTSYPQGFTISRTNPNGADPGWRYNGFAITIIPRSGSNFIVQFNYPFEGATGALAVRFALNVGGTPSWTGWTDLVGQPIAPTGFAFENGWNHFNIATDRPGTYAINDRIVTIEGKLKDGNIAVDATITTLPVGFRPARRETFPAFCAGGFAAVSVNTDGQLKIAHFTGTTPVLSLGRISFRAF